MRLNRYIANAGVCSRREADALIESGVVTVNGEIVVRMGFKVNAGVTCKSAARPSAPKPNATSY